MIAMKEQFKETVALVAEPVRATILWTLLDGKSFTATELAMAADTSASNISMHLAKLVNAGLLKAEYHGRHRYYSFAGKEVAYAIEAISSLVPFDSKKTTAAIDEVPAIKKCRSCYDHLAGKTGVAVTDALLKQKIISAGDKEFDLTAKGKKWFSELGIDVKELQQQRRSFLRPCLDWSERRYHIAGSLAAAFLQKMFEEDWVRRIKNSRALVVTAKGEKLLYEKLKVR